MTRKPPSNNTSSGEFILFQTEDGRSKIQVRFEDRNLWLTQAAMAELFQTTPQNITIHLKAIYTEGELIEGATCKESLQVREEGKRHVKRNLKHYNLEAILAVGYRVQSHRGTQFRQWATQQLKELIEKGFVLDDERLKAGRSLAQDYFDELLARIRDIRSSERRFYQKLTDIYATSVDYDSNSEITQQFYATVQNKLHWAIHGQTAAEIIRERADANEPNMGLTSWKNSPHGPIRKQDVGIAKNYLSEKELKSLNLMATAYLDFAELQAENRLPMYMKDWVTKLDGFLNLSQRNILTHAGKVSHQLALDHAEKEFDKLVVKKMKELGSGEKGSTKPRKKK
jgi:hypothetical protein